MNVLNRQLYEHYWEKGWVVVEGVFERKEIDRIAALAITISFEELYALPTPSYTVDVSGDGKLAPRKIDWPFLKHPEFRKFVLDPRLVRLVTHLLGHEAFLIRDQLF